MDDTIIEGPTETRIKAGLGNDIIHLTTGGEGDEVDGGFGDDIIIVDNAIGTVLLTNHCYPPLSYFPTVFPDDKIIFRNPDLIYDE